MLRVRDDQQRLEPDMRVEIFQAAADSPGRFLERAPFGSYRIIAYTRVVANGTAWADITLRRLRRL